MLAEQHIIPGLWWHSLPDGRVQCDLCPRYCQLKPGQRGLCYVRAADEKGMVLTTWGRSSGFCIDPIEKKPLHHFYPGTSVLSFGTAGCNLACKFCQNWDISKARDHDRLQEVATPAMVADAAASNAVGSVAYTYNDPVIFAEYAIETAQACREAGVRNVAVSAGYITAEPRAAFFGPMDAANIDLKGFDERFYRKLTGASLGPVLETLDYLVNQTDTWVEITTLLIPGANDDRDQLERQVQWIYETLGPDVPLHFSAFHPDYKLQDREATPASTLQRARGIALSAGLHYVYTGNVHDPGGASTYCPGCGATLIERDWYQLGGYRLAQDGACGSCGHKIAGHFQAEKGTWGRRRQPVYF